MIKTAWILPLLMLLVVVLAGLAPARADDRFRDLAGERFHDLPGVVPEEERVKQESYSCTSSIENVYRGRGRYDILYGDTSPRRVYHCKSESGVTYSGTALPNTQWVPGLNPHHLPKEH
jgi:hypothetical protein